MDILGKYEEQRPATSAPVRQMASSSESQNGFFISLVMRFSGGKIENSRQASFVLLVGAGIIFAVSAFIFFRISGFFPSSKIPVNVPVAGPGDARFNRLQP